MSMGNKMPDAGGWFFCLLGGFAVMLLLSSLGGCVWGG